MVASDIHQSLLSFVRRHGRIPEGGQGNPWFEDGNIFLFTNDTAFKFYMGLLRDNVAWFEDRLQSLSDDSVDIVANHPAIQLEDSSEDLAYFLTALSRGCGREFPLDSNPDFIELAGILRLATKYGAKRLRENAIKALQHKFPSALSDWDLLAENAIFRWSCDPIQVINLAREVGAFSIIPAAMAFLTNDSSAGEVFGIHVHDGTRRRNTPQTLIAPEDIRAFALMKEYNHFSIVRMIKFLRELGSDCIQPPEPEPRPIGMSPVGTRRHEYRASICSKVSRALADGLAVKLVTEDPMGFRDFGIVVGHDVMSQKLRICHRCRSNLKNGYAEHREHWWNGIPRVLGLSSVYDVYDRDDDRA